MYILEGTIGAGKSTFLQLLTNQLPHITTVLEPIHDWQKEQYGQSLLAHFYQNPQRWAYTFELMTLMHRAQEHYLHQKMAHNRIIIGERSLYSGYYCFAHNSYEQQFMTTLEWELYQQWFTLLVTNKCKPPAGIIYLRVSPEIAYQRIQKRNRAAEKTLSREYLECISQKHEQLLMHKDLPALAHVPILVLNGDEEFEANPAILYAFSQTVSEFVHKTYNIQSSLFISPALKV